MRILLFLLLSFPLCAQLVGDKQSGLASAYSPEYDGAETAYGETYNKNELVAAHKAYPYNSMVRIKNEENGRSVTVRIVDKGPFIRGRIIEVSDRAASELAMQGQRTVPVELTLLSTPDQPGSTPSDQGEVAPPPLPTPQRPVREADEAPTTTTTTSTVVKPPEVRPAPVQPALSPSPAPEPAAPSTPKVEKPKPVKSFATGVYRVNLLAPPVGRYAVQVGSFTNLERAMDKIAELQGKYFDDILLHKLEEGKETGYKVLLGPFRDRASAQRYAQDLAKRYNIKGFSVDLGETYP